MIAIIRAALSLETPFCSINKKTLLRNKKNANIGKKTVSET